MNPLLRYDVRIHYAKGAEIAGTSKNGFNEAIEAAKQSDASVVVLGEEALMSGEAASRATLELPGVQQDLLKAVHRTGTPVVFVLMSGRPLTITWADQHVPAILETWFLGTESGHAIADILFGDDNPSGKLPVTFPRTVGQVPYYYDHKNTGRPMSDQKYTSKYIDVENTPLYPFGYGLSYTDFEYSNLQLSADTIKAADTLQVSVDIENTGERTGEEVIQLYIRDRFASITRPVRELRDFRKISLKAGEQQTVSFELTREDLDFYNRDMKEIVEAGEFRIFVGTDSRETLETSVMLVE